MRKLIASLPIAVVAVMACVLLAPSAAVSQPDCSSRNFRDIAKDVYQPYYKPIAAKWRLRKLKQCASNALTRKHMRRIERNLVGGRKKARARWFHFAPYVGPGGTHWAVPYYVVYCESGGEWNIAASNGTGYYEGPYMISQAYNPTPFPINSWADKMAHHKTAYRILHTQGPGAWTCW